MLIRFFASMGLFCLCFGFSHAAFSYELPQTNSCFELSESFCTQLWSNENQGHLKLTQEEIHLNKSPKSDLLYGEIEHLHTLLNSESRLPNYLSKTISPQLKEFKVLMKKENDSPLWAYKYDLFKTRWQNKIKSLILEKMEKEDSELKKTTFSEMTVTQKTKYYIC